MGQGGIWIRGEVGSSFMFGAEIINHMKCETPLTHPRKDRKYFTKSLQPVFEIEKKKEFPFY